MWKVIIKGDTPYVVHDCLRDLRLYGLLDANEAVSTYKKTKFKLVADPEMTLLRDDPAPAEVPPAPASVEPAPAEQSNVA